MSVYVSSEFIFMYNRSYSFRPKRQFPGGYSRARRPFGSQPLAIQPNKYVQKAEVVVQEEVFVPKNSFSDFALEPRILANLTAKGYKNPTPIQDEALGAVLEGKDVVAIANTGTGKTAAFLLPIITKIMKNPNERALVLVPTRELAVQVDEEFRSFAKNMPIRSLITIGGAGISKQIYELRRNPGIVIATPGRIKDLINRNAINLSLFRTVVLDEVDRMVDIGFLPDVRYIVGKLAFPRQSLFFSATTNPEIDSILRSFTKDPVRISVRKTETAKTIDQDVIRVPNMREKIWKLCDLAKDKNHSKILVFVRTKRGADQVTRDLDKEGFFVGSIHGNKSQYQRTRAITDFKQGRIRVLVATDIAARGIDIPDISLVVNYDEPATYADYVHRIGRTGRAGKAGKALTFVMGR